MKKRLVIMAVLLILVFGGLAGFSVFKNMMMAQFFASMMTPPPVPVAVAQGVSEPVPRTLEAVGSIEAVRQVTLSPEVAGRVKQIFFMAGATVKAGDPVLQLNDDPERGDLERYTAQEKLAEINLGRSQKLVNVAAPRSQVDEYRSLLAEARGNIASTQARIEQKMVRAPFNGVLGIRQVNLGQYLMPGQPVVTLTDSSELFVNFTLPERNHGDLAVGQSVRLSVDAWPDKVFEAKISALEPQIGAETRTIKVQARLSNEENLLLPGMYAKAVVVLPSGAPAVIVPETAVDFTIYGDSVFVVKEDAQAGAEIKAGEKATPLLKADRVYVKTGPRFDGRVAVLEGLEAGDRVVTSGQIKLHPGSVVTLAAQDTLEVDRAARKDEKRNE
ncbi:MAG: efflux RND transporter periplasmic adaptor subunit [Rhodospirillales bacterium]|nr:efflux RND transporter periplasmic adaptor subunit [Rhodospirillales bacterium]